MCVCYEKITDVRVGEINSRWASLEASLSGCASHTWGRLTKKRADRSAAGGGESWVVIMTTEPLKQQGVTAALTACLTDTVYPR